MYYGFGVVGVGEVGGMYCVAWVGIGGMGWSGCESRSLR